jgi:hypothetical protein
VLPFISPLVMPLADLWPLPSRPALILSATPAMTIAGTLALHKLLTRSIYSFVSCALNALSCVSAAECIGLREVGYAADPALDGTTSGLGRHGARIMKRMGPKPMNSSLKRWRPRDSWVSSVHLLVCWLGIHFLALCIFFRTHPVVCWLFRVGAT